MSETIEWLDADGNAFSLLGGSDTSVLLGVEGRFAPGVSFVEDTVPLQAGARFRSYRAKARDVVLPLMFDAASETALRTALRAWAYRFLPSRGAGKLRITGPGGDQRELTCRYAGGLELTESSDTHYTTWQKAVVVFRAVDPYWYDTATSTATYTTGTAATFFPIFPIRLSSSEVFADATISNGGDVEAWPTWTITGPGSGLVLRNLTTDKSLSLTQTLEAGDVVTINTEPGVKTVTLDDGSNLFGNLASTSSLWPIEAGDNSVRVELSGATADSQVVVSYRRRFLSV